MAHIDPPSGLDEEYLNYYNQLLPQLERFNHQILEYIERDNLSAAADLLFVVAMKYVLINQNYTNDFLEMSLMLLNEKLTKGKNNEFVAKKNTVLYYDYMAYDDHSLSKQFLDAIGSLGLHIVYLIPDNAIDNIPKTKEIIEKYKGEIVTFTSGLSVLDLSLQLAETIYKIKPEYAFSYPIPRDVAGILAFMRFKGSMTRFMFDITDHGFWLGKNAFDYFFYGRDYSASIAVLYRGIPEEKMLEFHYSPLLPDVPFKGYPFPKNEDDFIIFSGGNFYKTNDEKFTYYNIVYNMLVRHKNVKFWYAFENYSPGFLELRKKFPDRVFNTPPRDDLKEVFHHSDMFLNTYPMFAGSTMVFAAASHCPPFTLKFNDEVNGLLRNDENLGVIFSDISEMIVAMDRYITDLNYRSEVKNNMSNAIYTRDEMIEYMRRAIFERRPHPYKIAEPMTKDFRAWHFKTWLKEIVS